MKLTRRLVPVLMLFVVAPLVGEVLLGATPVSRLGGLLPLSALYGGGAVLVRELARRRGGGWAPVFLLGAAYGIIEEGIAVQSLFNPTLFNAAAVGGRALGVNWIWAEWTTGYHLVWSIAIPILLVEMLVVEQRHTRWLGRTGLIVVGVLYALGVAFVALVFRKVVAPGYWAPRILIAAAALVSAVLVAAGLRWPARRSGDAHRPAPRPWMVLPLAAAAAGLWFWLLMLPDPVKRGGLALLPMAGAALVAVGLAGWIRRRGAGWTDRHRLALAAGALAPVMAFGFFVVTASNRVDHWGQAVACAIAVVLLALFGLQLGRRAGTGPAS